MVAKKKSRKPAPRSVKRVMAQRSRVPRSVALTNESRLLNLIQDPCEAEMCTGYAMSATGLVQRFTRFITPAATTETNFAYIWNPATQSSSAIAQKLSLGTGTPTNSFSVGPGEAFLEANADNISCLAGCIEVLYTGTLVNRKGYIGVCQTGANVMADIASGTTDLPTLLAYCQAVVPVPSHKVELKWSPSLRNFTGNGQVTEIGTGVDNQLMVVAIGVNPNDFVIRFTGVYEYLPRFTLGQPAPRVTKQIPPAVGERIVSALDRAGTWWHNLGNAAGAAMRMGYRAVYGAGQVAQQVSNATALLSNSRAVRYLEPAAAILALTG